MPVKKDFQDELHTFLGATEWFHCILSRIVGESTYENEVVDYRDALWAINGTELAILPGDEPEGSTEHYTISSYGAKGETLLKGEEDSCVAVMAHLEDLGWDDTKVFILNANRECEQQWDGGLKLLTP